MTEVKRMHTVPMVLLKHFANSEGKIWVYDKQNKRWFDPDPKNVAVEKGIYSQQVEKWLDTEIEDPVAPVFQKLSNRDADLNRNEMLLAANFIQIQMMRRSPVRDIVYERYDAPGSSGFRDVMSGEIKQLRSMYENEEATRKIQRIEDTLNTDPQALRQEIAWQNSFVKMLEAPMDDNNFLNEQSSILMRPPWRIIYTETERCLTSDNPILSGDLKVDGIGNLLPELCFPVSSQCVIYIGGYGQGGIINEVLTEDRLVRRFNVGIVANAHRFIYSTQKEKWVEKVFTPNPGCPAEHLLGSDAL